MIEKDFLRISAEKLRRSGSRIEDCVGRLNHEQIWTRNADNLNSIGNLVLHLCGNVRQWIGFGIGDLADQRDRDGEFAARGGLEPAELIERARQTVSDAIGIIGNFDAARLLEKVTIQNYEVTKVEAIYQVVEHFAQHTGQIIFVTKMLTGDDLGYFKHLNPGAAAHVP
ncbi:MAG TPA: DUF1572 family protein [Bryobacteraceae bacterium]|nr:DUF1572 family protein [Bryobacteraceae bacterium]